MVHLTTAERTATVEGAVIRSAQRHGGVFRLNGEWDAREDLRALGHDVSPRRLLTVLDAMVVNRTAFRVTRGVWVVPEANGRIIPFAAATGLVAGSYVSLWNVASFYNLTMQDLSTVSVISPARARPIDVSAVDLRVIPHEVTASRHFGWRIEPIGPYEVRIATIERMLIDLLWFYGTTGVPEASEIIGIWERAVSEANPYILAEFVGRMDSSRLTRRVGFLMERLGMRVPASMPQWRRGNRDAITLFPDGFSPLGSSSTWGVKAA